MSVRSVLVRYLADPTGAVAGARTAAAANASVATSARTANARMVGMGAGARQAAGGLGILNPKFLGPAGLVLGLAHAVSSANEFADSQLKLRTQIGLTSDEAQVAADAARNIGVQYGAGAQAAIDASWFIHSAGLRGTVATEALESAAQAAALGFGDMTTVADLVTSAMNAYGAENLSAAQATDILASAVREGKAQPEELASSMGQVLPIASEMGVAFEELAGVVAAMTRTGTNASTANIQMRQVLMDLLNPTNQARDALEEVGLSAEGLRRQIREEGLFDTLMTLREAFADNEEGMSQVFSNARSLMGVLDLLGANVEENAQIIASMADATGTVEEGLEQLEESARFQMSRFRSHFADATLEVGGPFSNALARALGLLNDVMDAEAQRRNERGEQRREEAPAQRRENLERLGFSDEDIDAFVAGAEAARDFGSAAGTELVGQLGKLPGPLAQVDSGIVNVAESTSDAATELVEFIKAMRDFVGPAIDADRATADWWEALNKLAEEAEDAADGIDLTTEAGRINRALVADATEALWGKIDALLAEGASIEELIPLVEGHVGVLTEEMRQAGFTEDAIAELVERYGLIPEEIITRIEADDRATRTIGGIIGQLDRLPSSFNVRANVTGLSASQLRAIGVMHDGGWVTGHGQEVPKLLERDEFVVNARDAQANAGLLEAINSGGMQTAPARTTGAAAGIAGGEINYHIFAPTTAAQDIVAEAQRAEWTRQRTAGV